MDVKNNPTLERKLFSLSIKYKKMADMIKMQVNYDAKGEDRKRLEQEHLDADDIGKALRELMWSLIRERINMEHGVVIGVRENFRIVSFPPTSGPHFPGAVIEIKDFPQKDDP